MRFITGHTSGIIPFREVNVSRLVCISREVELETLIYFQETLRPTKRIQFDDMVVVNALRRQDHVSGEGAGQGFTARDDVLEPYTNSKNEDAAAVLL